MIAAMAELAAELERALALLQSGHLAAAAALYENILEREPDHGGALHLLGVVALQRGDPHRAVQLISRAIEREPADALMQFNLACAFQTSGARDAALAHYDRAIALKVDFAAAYVNRGVLLTEMGSWDEAVSCYTQAIALDPGLAEAHCNLGHALRQLGRLELALESYDAAIAQNSAFAEAFSGRGDVERALNQPAASLASCQRAIELKPDFAAAHSNRGNALRDLGQLDAALASYEMAISLDPTLAPAYVNRGAVLASLGHYERAIASYEQAAAIQPEFGVSRGLRLQAKLRICDWRDIDAEIAALVRCIERRECVTPPFPVLALSGSAAVQKAAAQLWVQADSAGAAVAGSAAAAPALPVSRRRFAGEPIRVGYFSADYHNHATMQLIAGLLELHDRSRFHVTAFSFGPPAGDVMRQRVLAACADFIDVRHQPDRAVAQLARGLKIDIAMDLKGFTEDARPRIFSHRAAPLQISYLGYPGTMGAPYMDYLVADETLIPEGSEVHYSEKIIYMPDSYQVNDLKRVVAERVTSRLELGLPESGCVFCCFNNLYKITPEVFTVWMRLLERVPGSVLWLIHDNRYATEQLRRAAGERGVDPRRLVFAPRITTPEHLARHLAADVFLDTSPYNAHTTASDALWMGVPVITLAGETFAGRVAASLLKALRVPELIATTLSQYEEMAVTLATEPQCLAAVKRRLAEQRARAPLFDTALFTRRLEAAYTLIATRHESGLPPEHVRVPT